MFTIVVYMLSEAVLFLRLSCVFLIGQLLVRFSCTRKLLVNIMNKVASVSLPEQLYWHSLFSWPMMKALWLQGKLDIRKVASLGKTTPNPALVDPETGAKTSLSSILSAQKLHVLAFGSYSCPVFRMKFTQLKSIAQEFRNCADVSVIYIDEAHPADGWAFKDDIPILRHRSIEDRLKAVETLRALDELPSIQIYADSIKNEASKMFGVNAIRLYVIKNQTVLYEGGIGPTYYSLEEVKQVITNTCVVV